ncbi:cobalamin biosynthesis protein CobD [Corynebacterium kutscheri]|uniref:Cobalamin biosynthesis protein CobD n=1 Tax=Corynebacterium kutscheri TaxID=35755 RepID=A0A0F6QZ67_9CORY|nr:adenosylcobinamide-phosphate synthase CbiB [Corynebacterium kutscheri]AKE40967.1 cobalamin biosynthesis protein CobD [Corynebacterium kutscheri]VEH09266.1 cobalamin biosynthetic protein [Corynebacterium kutscheri]
MPHSIMIGMAADRILGDPHTPWHPVALFGRFAATVEKRTYSDHKVAGVFYTAVCVIPPTALSIWAYRRFPEFSTALALYIAVGGTTLEKTGERMHKALEVDDIDAARALVPWLCSRDPQLLDEAGIVRATVESLAENTSDAAIAPLVWAGIGGAPLVVLHRVVNTLDAMVGYKNQRYQEFGWTAARLDDLLGYFPARLTALIHTVTANEHIQDAVRAWREDAPRHPSPNAGPVEATAAAHLGVSLGGKTRYAYGVEMRPILGTGPAPTIETITQAVKLARTTQIIAAGVAMGLRGLRRYRRI